MKYEEAVEKLKAISNRQVTTKARLKFYSKKPRDNYRHSFEKYNSDLFTNKKEINYLLAIIKAHKQARKLYAEVKRLESENGTLVEVARFYGNCGFTARQNLKKLGYDEK